MVGQLVAIHWVAGWVLLQATVAWTQRVPFLLFFCSSPIGYISSSQMVFFNALDESNFHWMKYLHDPPSLPSGCLSKSAL